MNTKKICMLYTLHLISKCYSIQDILDEASDENYLQKYSVDSEESLSDDNNLFNTTLQFLDRLCVCLNETLKKSDFTVFENDKNSNLYFPKNYAVHQNINNNTCLNIKDYVFSKISVIKAENNIETKDVSKITTNDNNTEFEDVLFTSLIRTQQFHTYIINEYSIMKKASALDRQDYSTFIVILTINNSPLNSKTLSNITKLELYNILFKNSTLYIDIISANAIESYNKPTENKPYQAENCNLYSIYATLIKSKDDNNLKNYKILKRNGVIKIYIEVINIKDQDKLTKLCCNNKSYLEIFKKLRSTEIKGTDNFVSQKNKTTKMYKSIIHRIKKLMKRDFGNECKVLDRDKINTEVIIKNKNQRLNLIESSTFTDKGYFATDNKVTNLKIKHANNRLKSVFTSRNQNFNNTRSLATRQNNVSKAINFIQSNSNVYKDCEEQYINKTIDMKDVMKNITLSSSVVTGIISTTESLSSDIDFNNVKELTETIKSLKNKIDIDNYLSTTLSDSVTTLNLISPNTINFEGNVKSFLKNNVAKEYGKTSNSFHYIIPQMKEKMTTKNFKELKTASNLYLQTRKKPTTPDHLGGVSKETLSNKYIKLFGKNNNNMVPNHNKTSLRLAHKINTKEADKYRLFSTAINESTSSSYPLLPESEDIEFETILNSLSEKANESITIFNKNITMGNRSTTPENLSTTNKYNYIPIQQTRDENLTTNFKSLNTLLTKLYIQSTDKLTNSDNVRNVSKENLTRKYINNYTEKTTREHLIHENNKNKKILQFNDNTNPDINIFKYYKQVTEPYNVTIIDKISENVGITIITDKSLGFPANLDTSTLAAYTENALNIFGQLRITSNVTEASTEKYHINKKKLLTLTNNPLTYTEKLVSSKQNYTKEMENTTANTGNETSSQNAALEVNESLIYNVDGYKTTLAEYTNEELNLLGYLNSTNNIFERSTEGISFLNNLSINMQPMFVTSLSSEKVGLLKRNQNRNADPIPAETLSHIDPQIITHTNIEIFPFIDVVENLNKGKKVLLSSSDFTNNSIYITESSTTAMTSNNKYQQLLTMNPYNAMTLIAEEAEFKQDPLTNANAAPILSLSHDNSRINTKAYVEMYPVINMVLNSNDVNGVSQSDVTTKCYLKHSNFVKRIQHSINRMRSTHNMTKSKQNDITSSQYTSIKDTTRTLTLNKEKYVLNTLKPSNSSTDNNEESTTSRMFLTIEDNNFYGYTSLKNNVTTTNKLILQDNEHTSNIINYINMTKYSKPAIYATDGWPNKGFISDKATVFNNVSQRVNIREKILMRTPYSENDPNKEPRKAFVKSTKQPIIPYVFNVSNYNKLLNSSNAKNKNAGTKYLSNDVMLYSTQSNNIISSTSQKLKHHTEKLGNENDEYILNMKYTRSYKSEPVNYTTKTKYAIYTSTEKSFTRTTKITRTNSNSLGLRRKIKNSILKIITYSPGVPLSKVNKKIKYNTYEPSENIDVRRDPVTKKFSLVAQTTSQALQSNKQGDHKLSTAKFKKPKKKLRVNVRNKHTSPSPKQDSVSRSENNSSLQITKHYPVSYLVNESQKVEEIISTNKPKTILREIRPKIHQYHLYRLRNRIEELPNYDLMSTKKPKKMNEGLKLKWKPSYFYYLNDDDISKHDSNIMLINDGGVYKETTPQYKETEAIVSDKIYRHHPQPKYIKSRINFLKKYLYNSEYIKTTPSVKNTFIRGRNNMKYYNSLEDPFKYFNTEVNEYTTHKPTTMERQTVFYIRPTRAYKRYF